MKSNLFRVFAAAALWALSAAASADRWEVCPPTDVQGNAVVFGAADGSNEANCFAGAVDAWADAGDIDAGDTVHFAPGWYFEKHIVGDSGTFGARISIESPGAIWFDSLRIDGAYTVATNKSQTTGSSWRLVTGTADVYAKGMGNYAQKLLVDGVFRPFMTPHKASEADVLANIKPGEWAIITKTTDGFARTLYYRGAPSSFMRVSNLQPSPTSDWGFCNVCIVGRNFITWNGVEVQGYSPLYTTMGGVFIENASDIALNNAKLSENNVGIRIYKADRVSLEWSDVVRSTAQGIAIGATRTLIDNGNVNQIQSITKAATAAVTTKIPHGMATGDRVYFESIGGMTQLDDTEAQVTVTGATTFTIPIDSTSFGTFDGTGKLFIQSSNNDTRIANSLIEGNGTGPRYNGIDVTWANDDDGIGIGYRGGVVTGLVVEGNRIMRNGPQRNILPGEAGNQDRGRGIYVGTSETFNVVAPVFRGNWFEGNHQSNLEFTDTENPIVTGNVFAGTRHFDGSTSNLQLEFNGLPASGVTTPKVFGNFFTGESGIGAIYVNNVTGLNSEIFNNEFIRLRPKPGDTLRAVIYFNNGTNLNFAEGASWFYQNELDDNDLYQRGGSTGYDTVAQWAAATGQGTKSTDGVDPQLAGGMKFTSAASITPMLGSPICKAGLYVGPSKLFDGRDHVSAIGPFECDRKRETSAPRVPR